jgi:hypothetical protein
MKRKNVGRKRQRYRKRYIQCCWAYAKREQRKEEERGAKEKREKADKEQRMYDDLFGQKAIEKASVTKNEDYDPEEDFW